MVSNIKVQARIKLKSLLKEAHQQKWRRADHVPDLIKEGGLNLLLNGYHEGNIIDGDCWATMARNNMEYYGVNKDIIYKSSIKAQKRKYFI